LRKHQVVAEIEIEEEALALSFFRDERHACRGRIARGLPLDASSIQPDLAVARPVQTEHGFEEFGSPGADEAEQSDDLPAPERERHVGEAGLSREAAEFEQGR
jgi:hypothetical protein